MWERKTARPLLQKGETASHDRIIRGASRQPRETASTTDPVLRCRPEQYPEQGCKRDLSLQAGTAWRKQLQTNCVHVAVTGVRRGESASDRLRANGVCEQRDGAAGEARSKGGRKTQAAEQGETARNQRALRSVCIADEKARSNVDFVRLSMLKGPRGLKSRCAGATKGVAPSSPSPLIRTFLSKGSTHPAAQNKPFALALSPGNGCPLL